MRLVSVNGVADEVVVALQQELLDRQLASLGFSAAADKPQVGVATEGNQTSAPVQGAMVSCPSFIVCSGERLNLWYPFPRDTNALSDGG